MSDSEGDSPIFVERKLGQSPYVSIRSMRRRMCWIVPSCTLHLDGDRAEEASPQGLGQQLLHRLLELA